MVQREGWLSLWKGNSAAELMVAPYGALSFLSYQLTQHALTRLCHPSPSASPSPSPASPPPLLHLSPSLVPLLSGAVSGVTATVATYPLDLLRTRFAAQHSRHLQYHSLMQAGQSILQRDGVRGLYHGLWPTLVGIVPMMAIQFHTYEACKRLMHAYNARTQQQRHTAASASSSSSPSSPSSPSSSSSLSLSPLQQSSAGFIAGVVSKLATMPLDVIKKRSQVRTFDYEQTGHPVLVQRERGRAFGSAGLQQRPLGVLRMAQLILREEGIAGLYRGSVPSLLKAGPYAATIYLTYELTKAQLERRWHSREHG